MNEVHNFGWFRREDPIDEINRVDSLFYQEVINE